MAREMKNSGVEWIGYIPCSWEILPIHSAFVERREKVSDIEWEPLSVTKSGVVKQLEHAAKSNNHNDRKKVCVGDFAINSRSDRKESCGLSSMDGSVSLINTVLIANASLYSSKYVKYLLKNYGFAEEFYRWGTGIVADLWSTNFERMKNIKLPFPPLSEQQKIADFLDEKVKEIDNAIEKTKETIEAYRNYEKALISEYIKFGKKEVPKITTQYDYIGEIAYTHTVVPLKRLLYKPLKYGANVAGVTKNTGIRYIRITDIDYDGNLKSDNKQYLPEDEAKGYLLKRGTVLFARSGGTVGKTFLYNSCEKATFAGYLIAAESNDAVLLSEWLYLYTKSSIYENWKNHIFIRATIQNIGADKYNELPVVITSIDEQRKIVLAIKEKHNIIENIIHNEEKLIALLNNYKKSLIYEYVTGKKEVE